MTMGNASLSDPPDTARREPSDRLSKRAYVAIIASLRAGALQPGERLILRPLAARLGLSATPVREALLRLVSEGALGLDSRNSVQVPVLANDEIRELLELRRDLEGRAASLAARRGGQALIEGLLRVQSELAHAVESGQADAIVANDDAFHHEIVLASGMRMLPQMADRIRTRLGPVVAQAGPDCGEAHAARHDRVIQALAERDPEAARVALLDDLVALSERIEAARVR